MHPLLCSSYRGSITSQPVTALPTTAAAAAEWSRANGTMGRGRADALTGGPTGTIGGDH